MGGGVSGGQSAEKDAGEHDYSTHNWWECEVCHERVSDILDARLRKGLIAEGVPERDADRLIAHARDEGRRLREAHVLPPGE